MQKIALINCFFGTFPWYFPFFIKSCTSNPTVDFLIFSDNDYKGVLPSNVRIMPFTLARFNELATAKLGFEVSVKKPYKLCDFKPAYGLLFSDYLVDYDFWGMCDIDIILGRIREFMTPELLENHDVISTRNDYLSGWFLLFKNTTEINSLFMKSKDYKKVFTSDTHYCFDECNFKHLQLDDESVSILDIPCEIESMEHVIRREQQGGTINAFFDLLMVDGLCGKIQWNNGILSYNKEFEILLYHLIRYKANDFADKTVWKMIPDVFFIDKYTFRKQSTHSIAGLYDYFVANKWIPLYSNLKQLSQFVTSNFLKSKRTIDLNLGSYKNKLGDSYLIIAKNNVGETTLAFEGYTKSVSTQLIPSKYKRNRFYIKSLPLTKCNYVIAKNGITENIQLIYRDGSIVNYELQNNQS
jgi:hypothetical protein